MEALERLQAVQTNLRRLHTHGIATTDTPSNRFLADFLILLGGSGRSSDEMERLCEVLVDAIPKMRRASIYHDMAHEDISVVNNKLQPELPKIRDAAKDSLALDNETPRKDCVDRDGYLPTSSLNLKASKALSDSVSITTRGLRYGSILAGEATHMVGFKSMERARSTLEDFCRSYFMFHGMDVQNPVHVFHHLPLLVFIEASIYQLDEQNEDQLCPTPSRGASNFGHGSPNTAGSGFGRDAFAGLRAVLSQQDLLTKRIEDVLMDGLRYWKLEQSLCTAIATNGEVKVEDVLQAIGLKSFDYRVLNLILYGLRKEPVNEAHYEFLSVSELLVEIADDLFDYEEDVGKNSFNVLRMFLYIYGPHEAPCMLAKFIGESEDKYQAFFKELEPSLRDQYEGRCQEAVKEGGSKSLHVSGSWTIPPLITDESSFRKQISCYGKSQF